jgi:hypothetical protein
MADITKCEGTECPLKETCYRFNATDNEFRQSYFVEVPYKKDKNKCNYYWETKIKKIKNENS